MHVQPVLNSLRASLINAGALAGSDPTVDAAIAQVLDALGPALRVAAIELAEQAAGEVRAQLPDHTVDVVLADGDPTLRITEGAVSGETPLSEDLDARITLRLPPSLKELVERAADATGESINAWVVEALGKRARGTRKVGQHYSQSFDL